MRYKSIVFVAVCWNVAVTLAQEAEHVEAAGGGAADPAQEQAADPIASEEAPQTNVKAEEADRLSVADNSEEAENEDTSQKDNYTFVALIDIVFTDGCKRTCTGAIIHDNVVITAAHCFTMIRNAFLLPELTMSFVVIGTKLMFETGYEQYLPIERVVTHPKFKGWTADLALVFTFANMMSDKPGQILPLATESPTTPVDSNVTVLSWGKCKADLEEEEMDKSKKKKKKEVDSDQIIEVTKSVLDSREPDDAEETTYKKKNHRDRRTWIREKPVQDKYIKQAENYQVHYKLQQNIPSMNTANQGGFQLPYMRAHENAEVQDYIQRKVVTADKSRYIAPSNVNKKPAKYVNGKSRTVLTSLTDSNKKINPYSEYVANSNEDLTGNWNNKGIPTMKRFAQTVKKERSVNNENFDGHDGDGYNPIQNDNKRMKQQYSYNTGWIHQNNNNQNRRPIRHNRRNLPVIQEFHRFQHFKNWRRQIGQQHNNLTVGMFGYVNLAACKKIVERTLPPIYELKNKHEVLCYSSEEFYITNEDSGAPVVQAEELVAITIGGVQSDGEHVAVGMRISCFCNWITENLPNGGGASITCCTDCCSDKKSGLRTKNKKERRVNPNLPSSRLRSGKEAIGGTHLVHDVHRFVNDDDDQDDVRKDEMYASTEAN